MVKKVLVEAQNLKLFKLNNLRYKLTMKNLC